MGLNKKPYRGTRDFFPSEQRVQNHIFEKMKSAAEMFGYEPYNGPLLEEVELYRTKSGEELVSQQIYSFQDRGNREVAIRPEMTPTLARMVSQVHKEIPKPIRWYSIPNLMRYEKPQRGRLREHWQLNVDIFGAPTIQGEVEILQVAIFLLQNFGANNQHFEVHINDRKIVDAVLAKVTDDKNTALKLYKIIDKAEKVSTDTLEKMIDELSLSKEGRENLKLYLELKDISEVEKRLGISSNLSSNLRSVREQLKAAQMEEYLVYSPKTVRGVDYYTGIVFEIFDKHPDNNRAICGGGTYDNLLEIFGETNISGTGFGLGDLTLKDFLQSHKLLTDAAESVDAFIACEEEAYQGKLITLAFELRQKGIRVLNNIVPQKAKKIFSSAEKRGARFSIIVSEKDIKVKNLRNKQEDNFNSGDSGAIAKHIHES